MLARHIEPALRRALRRSPVVLLTGARQVGKSTLAQELAHGPWPARYVTLDERAALDAALGNPDGFLEVNPAPLVIDEVQRAPDLLRAVKLAVDRRRRPGLYLLTGSANLLTLKSVSETLAGRVEVFTLEPLAWTELAKTRRNASVERLLRLRTAADAVRALGRTGPVEAHLPRLREATLRGGFPVPALMRSAADRRAWFEGYRKTYLERDVRDIAAIERLPEFNKLVSLLALRTGQVMNFADVGRDAQLPMMTLRRYCGLLEATYQLFFLQPYFGNPTKRWVKAPKVYVADSGSAAFLSGADSWEILERQARTGALVETWAACELRRILSSSADHVAMYYWRTHAGAKVDFVLEGRDARVMGVEVKLSSGVASQDLVGLKKMREDLGDRMGLGVLAYGGGEVIGLDRHTIAVPLSVLLGPDGA
jgi:predicted AAA+ superfamily ATPase